MRMARVNITVPDHVIKRARAAGLNVSQVATAAMLEELDRQAKAEALDAYLAELEAELGPITPEEQAEAVSWARHLPTTEPGAGPTTTDEGQRRSA
jgi:post-segregation antitoxin (ccd killing protein)